ncbi:MAG: MATE family efflux transporter [Sphingobium sp.]
MDLTNGPIARTLLLFALPALGTNVLQSINGSINAVWIGQFLGANGLAATANANLVMFMMFSLVFGFGMASTIVIGQSVGRGDIPAMRQAVGTGMALFILLGVMTALFGWLLAPWLLHLLGTPAEVFPSALIYIRVMFLGLPSGLLTVFLSMALRGTGDSLTPLLLSLPGMVVDVVLNPVLIRGLGPAPELGIMGAAIATLAANLTSFILMIGVIYGRDLPIRLRGEEFRYLLPRREIMLLILRKGIPMGMQMIVMSLSALVMLGLVNMEGTDTVAAYGAANQLWTYIQMPAIAIGMAISTMAAQNIGAGRWDRVQRIASAGVVTNLCLTGSLVALTLLLDRAMLHLFLPDDPTAVAIARHVSLVASWSFILMGITMVLSSVTRANGATVIPLIIMVVAYIPGRLGAAYALRPAIGAEAIWWSFPIGAALSLVLTYLYFRYGNWQEGAMIVSAEEAEELCQSEAEPAGRLLPNG